MIILVTIARGSEMCMGFGSYSIDPIPASSEDHEHVDTESFSSVRVLLIKQGCFPPIERLTEYKQMLRNCFCGCLLTLPCQGTSEVEKRCTDVGESEVKLKNWPFHVQPTRYFYRRLVGIQLPQMTKGRHKP